MMRRSLLLLRASISAIPVAALVACADSNAPEPNVASYELVSYAGNPLPVVLRRLVSPSTQGGSTLTCDDKLTASKLELLAAHRFTQADSSLLVCDDGRPDAPSQVILQGTYTAGADSITLDTDTGGGTHYVQMARRGSGTLTIYRRQVTGGSGAIDLTELVYRHK